MKAKKLLRKTTTEQHDSSARVVDALVFGVLASLQNGQPDKQSSGDEAEDAGGNLEAPGVRQVVVVWIAADPEVLALELECVVRKDHGGHHQKHSCQNKEYWRTVNEKSLAAVVTATTADESADDPDEKKENKKKSKRLQDQSNHSQNLARNQPRGSEPVPDGLVVVVADVVAPVVVPRGALVGVSIAVEAGHPQADVEKVPLASVARSQPRIGAEGDQMAKDGDDDEYDR